MDSETPEMEAITNEMRVLMAAWIDDPDNEQLKQRYSQLQQAYQKAFVERGSKARGSTEAAHQAYS
jgi:hypothetical protein